MPVASLLLAATTPLLFAQAAGPAPVSPSLPARAPAAADPRVKAEGAMPSRWVGARIEERRIEVSAADTGARPRPVVSEPPGSRSAGLEVTDVAYDARRGVVYVGTCCEPGSGHLWRADLHAPAAGLLQDDQGFAVDVAGPASALARTDTFGTLAVRASDRIEPDVRADAGVADVAVDGAEPTRVLALVDSRRLQALVPTVSRHEPELVMRRLEPDGAWTETGYPLPRDTTYCRVVPLKDGQVGLLAGAFDARRPLGCTGDRLDAYDTTRRRLRTSVLTLPDRVRHLSIDESSTFLIFTTVQGAVGWRTLDGRGGSLASGGFAAADW